MKVIENAMKLWNNPQDLIEAWNEMPTKTFRENLIMESILNNEVHSIVDLGCGNGRLFGLLKHWQCEYVGYDSSLPMILEAKKLYPDNANKFSIVDILNFQSGIFYDIIICQDVAQHYNDPIQFIKTVLVNWSAKSHIFSLLVGDKREDLYNSTVVPFSKLLVFLRDITDSNLYASTHTYIEPFDDTEFSWFLIELHSKN